MDSVLIVDDDVSLLESLKMHFEDSAARRPLDILTASSATEALLLIQNRSPSLVILDMMLPDRSGLDFLPELKQLCSKAPIVVATAFHDMEATIKAMKAGAFDFLHKPFVDVSELDSVVDRALKVHNVARHSEAPPPEDAPLRLGDIVGNSPGMQGLLKDIGRVTAAPMASVLLHGESGTGKELVARVIHTYSSEKSQPFVGINCSAIVPTLLESELFGHEKGAFTGALSAKQGKFELAEGGTIFLDEIGDMSLPLQAKLLRVLQEREFERVGGLRKFRLNARMVAATHRDLAEEVRQGRFREDLYQRLKVIQLEVPPLRERREDIPALVHHLLRRISEKLNKPAFQVAPEVMAFLCQAPWTGNVRELENVLTHAVVRSSSDVLVFEELPNFETPSGPVRLRRKEDLGPFPSLEQAEGVLIARALKLSSGHKGKTCQLLGISRPTLERKLKKYALEALSFPN
jgi:two-component system response regulator AtoC